MEKKTLNVGELAALFSVSTMTVRRDLALLEKQGILTMTYGGAYLNEGTSIEPSFSLKSGQMAEAKSMMGIVAANLIHDGDSIIIDCGTTTMHVAKHMRSKNVTVITNSSVVSNMLQGNSKIKLIMAPGVYSEKSAGFVGPLTIDFFRKFIVDKAFIGSQGFDLERGATVPDESDAQLKDAICQAGKQRILMVGHEKLGVSFMARFFDPTPSDIIVSDHQVPEAFQKEIFDRRIQLVLAH
jgi:DeoR/GlpR family transcriptional regulator of sugar metabolism